MELKITLNEASFDRWQKGLEDKLQVAAIRGYEKAVELSPAAGESPYSTGYMRQSIRVQKTGDLEYTIFSPARHSIFMEFGTGPKGRATGAVAEFPQDPQPTMRYHNGEVLVTRSGGRILNEPYIRRTQGMEAQPFIRPALLEALRVFKELLKNS